MQQNTQLTFLKGLYQKDTERLELAKKAKYLYRLAKYVYSRVEELHDETKRPILLQLTTNLMYDCGAMMVLYNPDGDVKQLEQVYDEVAVLPLPYRYTYLYPTTEEIYKSVKSLIKETDKLTHVSKKYFNNDEIKALGMLFDNIDVNIVKLNTFLNDEKQKARRKV